MGRPAPATYVDSNRDAIRNGFGHTDRNANHDFHAYCVHYSLTNGDCDIHTYANADAYLDHHDIAYPYGNTFADAHCHVDPNADLHYHVHLDADLHCHVDLDADAHDSADPDTHAYGNLDLDPHPHSDIDTDFNADAHGHSNRYLDTHPHTHCDTDDLRAAICRIHVCAALWEHTKPGRARLLRQPGRLQNRGLHLRRRRVVDQTILGIAIDPNSCRWHLYS